MNRNEEEKNKKFKESFANFYKNKTNMDYPSDKPSESTDSLTPSDLQEASVQMPPKVNFESPENFQSKILHETDPDLIVGYEIVDLPSKGIFYNNNIDKIKIEYLTSKDEDILTTPSLIQDGTVIDIVLKKKIKTPNIEPKDLLIGDKNALILFLRASSYGHEYEVEVADPRNQNKFKEIVDLTKLKYKKTKENPDDKGEFSVEIPMRKKNVKFKLLTSGQEDSLFKRAKSIKEAYNKEYSEYNTMKLKAHITEIDGNRDRSYIERFTDAMPVRDALTIRSKIVDVTPDIDMSYEFKTKDGFKFNAKLTVGVDFFFPNL